MRKINLSFISFIVIAALFLGVVAITLASFDKNTVYERQADVVEKNIINAAALCYAQEGKYPDELSYLQDNYGIQLDTQRYFYHYDRFASNIMPDIKVYNKYVGGN